MHCSPCPRAQPSSSATSPPGTPPIYSPHEPARFHKANPSHSAVEHAERNGKKTVNPHDVFDALTQLEFDTFLPRLEAEVTKFTSIQADKRNTYRKKVREEKKTATASIAATAATTTAAAAAAAAAAATTTGTTATATSPSIPAGPGVATNGERASGGRDSPPAAKRARRSSGDADDHHTGTEDEGDHDETGDVEDDEVEDDEIEEEVAEDGLTEDALEEREDREEEEDDMADGDESD